jgi:hypothetical protein
MKAPMRIRTRTLLGIVPVFAGLAIVLGILILAMQRLELEWALEEQGTALGVSAATMLDATLLEPSRRPALQEKLARLVTQNDAVRIFILSPDGADVWVAAGQPGTATTRLWAGAAAARAKALQGSTSRREGQVLSTLAPITGTHQALGGWLGVDLDATAIDRSMDGQLRNVGQTGVAILLVGVLAALLLNRLIQRRIAVLESATADVAAGQEVALGDGETIREFGDFGLALSITSSVLRDALNKSRRALIENERFRSDQDLAGTYGARLWPDLVQDVAGLRLAGSLHGQRSGTAFMGAAELAGQGFALVGAVRPSRPLLRTYMLASAARTLALDELRTTDPASAYAHVAELYEVVSWQVARWRPGGDTIDVWRLAGGELIHEQRPWPAGGPLFLHDLGEAAGTRLEVFARHFGASTPAELRQVLGSQADGGLWVIGGAV